MSLNLSACSDGGDDDKATATPAGPTVTQTPNANAALEVFQQFVDAVARGDQPKAWTLYAASIPNTIRQHRAEMGCEFTVFQLEFERMQHLFGRTAPFAPVQSFPVGPTVEIQLSGADGTEFLATLLRVEANEMYRLRFLNNGQVAAVPGAPDPLPPPEDPQGLCGIWNGPR
ncbi:MAG: hypothetical protein ACREUU_09695 [Gammaproteobacteria bacterium]